MGDWFNGKSTLLAGMQSSNIWSSVSCCFFLCQTHSCCFSSALMRLFSSSSLCSLWHRCLCWARKRNTTALKKHGVQHQAMKQNTETVYICAWDTVLNSPRLCFFLLFDHFLQVISLLRHTLDFLMTQFELFSKKKCWIEKNKKTHF